MQTITLIRPAEAFIGNSASANKPVLPIGIAYLASALKNNGYSICMLDAIGMAPDTVNKHPFRDVSVLGGSNSLITDAVHAESIFIGISVMFSHNWPNTRELIAAIKHKFPKIPIVLGGEFPSSNVKECFEESEVDVVCIGEGEETILAIAHALKGEKSLDEVEGVAFRNGQAYQVNPRRKRISNVDEIIWPAWEYFNIEAYKKLKFGSGLRINSSEGIIPILATRGCPYSCTFCTSPTMWTTTYITRSPTDVVDEIAHYAKHYQATNFPFQDLTAILKKQWIIEFCEVLIRRNLGINWQLPSGTRSEVIDENVAELLYKSGLKQMGLAVESGNDEIRKKIKKKVKRDQIYYNIKSAVKSGLTIQVYFIIGFPGETKPAVRQTLKMMRKVAWMGAQDVGLNHYMPLAGTELQNAGENGLIPQEDLYMIPLYGHKIGMDDWRKVNKELSSAYLTRVVLGGILTFYCISFFRYPLKFFRFFIGLFSKTDTSRLQVAVKTMFAFRKKRA
ncbi:MAG: B12-binding domain-containing radical SAM protein [Flavobacteriales bacterium]|nr:B12-binding domain-containing radical SAM protein [Flavobacteriales bacterium]